jgi:DNA-binding CsgD family transcriptional regulator
MLDPGGNGVVSYLEVSDPEGRRLVALEAERVTVGTAPSNDVTVSDPTVSRLHAVLERYAASWCVRDLGSRNGTFVNGERVIADRAVRGGDEIRVGRVRLLLREPAAGGGVTAAMEEPPRLTARERDVLIELCRPLLAGDVFTEPAPIRTVAAALFVSEAAVKQHLTRLYAKFGITGGDERRRVQLANAAVARGAVGLVDLRPSG